MNPSNDRRVVYDTDTGRVQLCKKCGEPIEQCRCRTNSAEADSAGPRDGYVRLARDKKGRGGKTVTVITGLPGDAAAIAQLAQELRRLCGAGGTVKGTTVEIQGEHRDRLETYLKRKGYKTKRVGG